MEERNKAHAQILFSSGLLRPLPVSSRSSARSGKRKRRGKIDGEGEEWRFYRVPNLPMQCRLKISGRPMDLYLHGLARVGRRIPMQREKGDEERWGRQCFTICGTTALSEVFQRLHGGGGGGQSVSSPVTDASLTSSSLFLTASRWSATWTRKRGKKEEEGIEFVRRRARRSQLDNLRIRLA